MILIANTLIPQNLVVLRQIWEIRLFKPTYEPTTEKRRALLDGRFIEVNFSKLTLNNQIFRNDVFVIIIIHVNFHLKQLTAKFLPLTISYSCCSIPISYLVASHVECCMVDFRQRLQRFILCTWRSSGPAHEGGG